MYIERGNQEYPARIPQNQLPSGHRAFRSDRK
nr:MAG TPA: hypothetical protein [Caudoviricetes sp.]